MQNNNKLEGGPFEDIKKFSKFHKAEKTGKSLRAKKVETFCFRMLVKNLAHTHRFEHEPSGLESKHLTTRPRTSELCELRAETSYRAKKKAPALSHNTCLSASVKMNMNSSRKI